MKHRFNNKSIIFFSIAILFCLFFSFYKFNQVPPCINADEAAFGYNAYSILKTARDEYGAFLPLRFVSFLDFKLPLYTYFTVPFMALFGLGDLATRLPNVIIAIIFICLTYKLSLELFASNKSAIISSILLAACPWIYILTRHAHEGPLSVLFILMSIYFFIRFDKTNLTKFIYLANLMLLGAVFSYHSARIFLFIFAFLQFVYFIVQRKRLLNKNFIKLVSTVLLVVIFSTVIDAKYGVNRVANLLFLKNEGFALRINEYMGEHPNRAIHNKATEAVRDIAYRYIKQISPEFFVVHGDTNWRFGFENMGLITPIEYLFIFVGLFYLFKNKERYRWLILLLLFISPLPNALTWQDASIIRTYIQIFPMVILIGYGIYQLWTEMRSGKVVINRLIILTLFSIYGFFLYNNWDIYLNHYPKRAVVTRAWQCGYKEMVDYISANYDRFDKFVITDRHGQPYIYLLYYLRYDPNKYQKQAKISAPDKYGFGQIKKFDKFNFIFSYDPKSKNTAYIGYPDEFAGLDIDKQKIRKITYGSEEMFWIYEN